VARHVTLLLLKWPSGKRPSDHHGGPEPAIHHFIFQTREPINKLSLSLCCLEAHANEGLRVHPPSQMHTVLMLLRSMGIIQEEIAGESSDARPPELTEMIHELFEELSKKSFQECTIQEQLTIVTHDTVCLQYTCRVTTDHAQPRNAPKSSSTQLCKALCTL
jgi:hypothetical protein